MRPHPFRPCPRPPSPAQEFERQERERAEEAEVRAQAAELRRLKAAGLLGEPRCAAPPRPVAYTAQEDGEQVFRPFPAAFRPVLPAGPPMAVARTAARAAAAQQQRGEAERPHTPLHTVLLPAPAVA